MRQKNKLWICRKIIHSDDKIPFCLFCNFSMHILSTVVAGSLINVSKTKLPVTFPQITEFISEWHSSGHICSLAFFLQRTGRAKKPWEHQGAAAPCCLGMFPPSAACSGGSAGSISDRSWWVSPRNSPSISANTSCWGTKYIQAVCPINRDYDSFKSTEVKSN